MIELSPKTYDLLQQQAAILNVTPEEVIAAALRLQSDQQAASAPARGKSDQNGTKQGTKGVSPATATPSTGDSLPAELKTELDQLAFLTDDELWQAARTQLRRADHARMQTLLDKQQAVGLTPVERAEAESLADRYDRIMLVRAKAAVFLKRRGHNIASLGPNATAS